MNKKGLSLLIITAALVTFALGTAPSCALSSQGRAAPHSPTGPTAGDDSQSDNDVNSRVYLAAIFKAGNTVSTIISPGEGGQLSTRDGYLTVNVPPGAVTGDVTLKLSPCDTQAPAGVSDVGLTVAITAHDADGKPVTTLDQPLEIQWRYIEQDLTLVPPASLTVYHRHASGEWTGLPTTLDQGSGIARASTSQLSDFGLFGTPESGPVPLGMAVDASGALYWTDFGDFNIHRAAPGAAEPTVYYDYGVIGQAMSLDAGDMDVDPDTGTLYFTDGTHVRAVTTGLIESTIYDSNDGYSYDQANSIAFDPNDGSLYIAGKWSIVQIDPQSGALIRKLPQVSTSPTSQIQDVIVDARGRLFAITVDDPPFEVPFTHWGNMFYLDSPGAYYWSPVAYGLAYPRRLAADDAGNVYVTNVWGDAITVVGSQDPGVTGFIHTDTWPRGIAVKGDTLMVGAGEAIYTFPRQRRDAPQGTLSSAGFTPSENFSGQGTLITVTTGVQEPVTAHNVLRIGDTPIREMTAFSEGRLTYKLPHVYWTGSEWARALGPSGRYNFTIGTQTVYGADPALPGWGNWQFASWAQSSDTILLTQSDWLVWSTNATAVVSQDGLFPPWDNNQGSWLAHQFKQSGTFTFEITDDAGQPVTLYVEVTPLGPGGRQQKFQVSPATGGTLHNHGVALEIPPGALPGSAPYTVTLSSAVGNYVPGRYPASSHEYRVQYDPEPEHLNRDVVLRLPYDPDAISDLPQAGLYDPGLGDYIALDSQAQDGQVALTFQTGDYPGATSPLPETTLAPSKDATPLQTAGVGQQIVGSLNTVGQSLWWAVGLPNAKVVDTNFGIVYHDADVTEAYAQGLLNALNDARNAYIAQGYSVPDEQIIVKIAPWATTLFGAEGFVPRTSLLGHWYMFVNDQLAPDQLQVTAAHEFFHIVQSETMSDEADAPKWWLEGTATWAEYAVCPNANWYEARLTEGGDFATVPYPYWSSNLSSDQAYGTVAFALYLEAQHPGAIQQVFARLREDLSVRGAIAQIVGDEATFYADFARAYWTQSYGPSANWNLSGFISLVELTAPSTDVLAQLVPGMSSGLVNVRYNQYTTPDPPASFTQASGSVVRAPQACEASRIYVLDSDRQDLNHSFIGAVESEAGYAMDKLVNYNVQNDLYVLYINVDGAAGSSCNLQVRLEAPTIEALSPDTVTAGETTRVQISGQGFGPQTGSVNGGTLVSWSDTAIQIDVSPSSAGTHEITVRHALNVTSNPQTLTVVE